MSSRAPEQQSSRAPEQQNQLTAHNFCAVVTWYKPTQDFVQNALSYAWYFDQIFIVDNTEGDNSSLAAQIPNAIYIPNGKNLGIAKALNQGIEAALSENTKGRDYRWVMTMDQDSAWDHDQLTQYIRVCIEKSEEDAAIASFAPSPKAPSSNCQRHSTLGIWKRKLYALVTKKQYQEKKHAVNFGFVDTVVCSGNVVEIEAWEKVGKFEELLFIDYVDHDFCLKLGEAGYKICKFAEISMEHQTANALKPFKQTLLPNYIKPNCIKPYKNGDPVRFFYVMRNSLYASKKYPDYVNAKKIKKQFHNLILAHCVFNRKALRNIKVLIRAYKDYKQTLLPMIDEHRVQASRSERREHRACSRKFNGGALEFTAKVGCPLNCRACPQDLFIKRYLEKRPWEDTSPAHRTTTMSLEDFKTCVDNLPQDKPISFSGWGEPQLNPAFTDMVLYAHSAGHTVNLNTTLLGMTRKSYERIRTVPFRSVTLHIPDRDSNSHFTLSSEYFELLNLVLADAAAGRFRITGYSCHGEVHPAVADIFKKNGLATPVGTPFSKLHDRAGNIKDKEVNHPKERKGRILCALRSNLDLGVLLPDGTVDLCCMDMGMRHILGNLLTQSYDEIMGGEEIQKLRRCMESEKAGDCVCRHCCYAKNDFEYFVKLPIQRRISLIRRKVGLRTRLRRLFKKSSRHT